MALALGLVSLLGLLWLMAVAHSPVMALDGSATIRYVDGATGHDNGNDCIASTAPCAAIQHAVDVAAPGDEIRVATGVYTGVQARAGITQVVCISKSVTVRGGYTATNWTTPYPLTQPTTLDAQQRGRVLYITGASAPGAGISVTIEGLRITGGDAAELGGGSSGKDAGGGVYVVTATATIRDNHVVTNTALIGGGMYFQDSDGTSLIDNLISDNSTSQGGHGGGLYLHNSAHVTLTGNTISDNEAGPWSYGFGAGGGALFDNCPGVTLSENGVTDNRASWGGGLRFQDSPTVTLMANTISGNWADHAGPSMKHYAGVFFYRSDNATLIGNTISGNHTANHCGGVCFESSHNAVLRGNTITSNTRKAGWDGFGVGVYLYGGENASLVGNNISNNTGIYLDNPGTIRGGGLYIGHSTTELISNTISSNGATRGGGLYVAFNSLVTLTSNTITGNAVYDACGSWCDGPKGTGGGLHLSDSAATLSNTIIADNQVEIAGGGLYVERSAITLTNAIVADNQITLTGRVTGTGSGLYIAGSSAWLLHPTIARNGGGDGTGIHIISTPGATSTVALTNTILVSHTVGITVAADSAAMLTATLWGTGTWANLADWGGVGTIVTGTTNLWADPDFVDPDGGDYHIGHNSAAIDAGADAGVDDDIDGDRRDAAPDLGADEFVYHVYLPLVLRSSGW
jgi:parallel beta-helix repeat protein